MFKVNNKNIRTTPGVFIVNFEHISHLIVVFLLLTLAGKCRLVVNLFGPDFLANTLRSK